MMVSRHRFVLAAVAACVLAAAGANAQAPRPGGQLVHGSVQEPDRIWGPVTGLTVSGEISQLVNDTLVVINEHRVRARRWPPRYPPSTTAGSRATACATRSSCARA